MSEYKVADVKNFILGGNSYFTIKNEVSGKYHKYHIKKSGTLYFVSVKEGNNWVYGGYMKKDNNTDNLSYAMGAKGSYPLTSEEIKGLGWVIRHSDNLDSRVSVLHHGKCACCGRTLDDEESVKRGFGPYCYKRMILG